MHHWMLFHQLSSRSHAKDKHGWAASITLQGIHGDMCSMDMTQSMKHQVEGPIMQEKDWTRAFGRCNSWSTRARKSWMRNDHVGRKRCPGEARGHPGRSAQAGRPPQQKEPLGSRLLASIPLLPQFVCSSSCAQNHRRHSQPSQA
jgi:hypothetical protein